MIDFAANDRIRSRYVATTKENKEQLEKHREQIEKAYGKITTDKYALGVELYELYSTRLYGVNYWGDCSAKRFFEYCEQIFDLSKSTVCNYLNIVSEFGNGMKGLKPEWEGYSWSLLVEMLSLTPEQRAQISPDWTVREIKDWKKELVQTSGLTETDFQKLDRIIKNQEPPEPERWRSCSRGQLIGYIERQDRYRDYLTKLLREHQIEFKIMEGGGWEPDEDETDDDPDEYYAIEDELLEAIPGF